MRWALGVVLGLVTGGWAQGTLTAQVAGTAQPDASIAAVWLDAGALLAAARQAAPFEPASVIVRPAAPAAAVPVPVRATAESGGWRVEWPVPPAKGRNGAPQTGEPVPFELTFGSAPAATPSPPLEPAATTGFLRSGDFERASADPAIPAGVARATFARDFRWDLDEGNHSLAFNAPEDGRGPIFNTPQVAVEPGQTCRFGFRWRARGAAGRGHPGAADPLVAEPPGGGHRDLARRTHRAADRRARAARGRAAAADHPAGAARPRGDGRPGERGGAPAGRDVSEGRAGDPFPNSVSGKPGPHLIPNSLK